jgi:hypothetical protein
LTIRRKLKGGIDMKKLNITDEDIRACLNYVSILADEEAGIPA